MKKYPDSDVNNPLKGSPKLINKGGLVVCMDALHVQS